MDLESFRKSVAATAPPDGLGSAVEALWWDAKGDWDKAHHCAQAQADAKGAWVHAYLHRKEGDARNAAGWYGRAGQPVAEVSLGEEWTTIARHLLGEA